MLKEYWLIDTKNNKSLNYCKANNIKEAEEIFNKEAETENYSLSDCVIVKPERYFN